MPRYLFRSKTADNENADAFIDAGTLAQAKVLYQDWCIRIIGEAQIPGMIWELPKASAEPQALDWFTDIEEVA